MFIRVYIVYRIACTHVPQHHECTHKCLYEFYVTFVCTCVQHIYQTRRFLPIAIGYVFECFSSCVRYIFEFYLMNFC